MRPWETFRSDTSHLSIEPCVVYVCAFGGFLGAPVSKFDACKTIVKKRVYVFVCLLCVCVCVCVCVCPRHRHGRQTLSST